MWLSSYISHDSEFCNLICSFTVINHLAVMQLLIELTIGTLCSAMLLFFITLPLIKKLKLSMESDSPEVLFAN